MCYFSFQIYIQIASSGNTGVGVRSWLTTGCAEIPQRNRRPSFGRCATSSIRYFPLTASLCLCSKLCRRCGEGCGARLSHVKSIYLVLFVTERKYSVADRISSHCVNVWINRFLLLLCNYVNSNRSTICQRIQLARSRSTNEWRAILNAPDWLSCINRLASLPAKTIDLINRTPWTPIIPGTVLFKIIILPYVHGAAIAVCSYKYTVDRFRYIF